ncbi:MAG: hypothetical protein QME68_01185 [Elusimicrobiota bacterium]|nr:hypothetical protein [Elusimicrobiota bacterium]
MISMSETTITIAALVFIAILIILAKLNRQIDNITNLLKQIRQKFNEHEETSKWNFDITKIRLEKIERILAGEESEPEIPWGKG